MMIARRQPTAVRVLASMSRRSTLRPLTDPQQPQTHPLGLAFRPERHRLRSLVDHCIE